MKHIFILLISIYLYADNIDTFFENMKKQETLYKNAAQVDINKTLQKDEFISSFRKKSLDNVDKSTQWLNDNIGNGTQLPTSKETNKKVNTIFYLFSTSQSPFMLLNFMKDSYKLESIDHDIQYFGVVQGMLSQKDLEDIYKPFEYETDLDGKVSIKMQPFIFRDLKIKQVPAYLFSKCTKGEFKFDECENKYLIKGEISLAAALEIVNKNDKSKEYLDFMNLLQIGK